MDKERCTSCSKEQTGVIPINRIIEKLDALFAKNDMDEAGRVLVYWENEARSLNDERGLLEILSEELGYYRKVQDKDRGLAAVKESLDILSRIDNTTISYATIYLNAATTMKSFGLASEALEYYDKAKALYEKLLPQDDYKMAGLFNNYATALMDLKRYDEGIDYYKRAINILKSKGVFAETAVSYVNLATLYYDQFLDTGEVRDDIIEDCLNKAYKILNDERIEQDGDYAYICEKCAEAFGMFGFFIQKQELEKRAEDIYKRQ